MKLTKNLFLILLHCAAVTYVYPKAKQKLPLNHDRFKEIMQKAYTDISGSPISAEESTMISQKGGNSTYGEITYESLKTVLDDLKLKKSDVFYDLGCGVGKTCLQVALTTPAKAYGVELSSSRVKKALQAAQLITKNHNITLKKNLQFYENDILSADLKKTTVAYMCSTCYSDDLMKKITEKLSQLSDGLRVITLKALPENKDFKLVKTYTLPMTWSSGSSVHLYVLNKKNDSSKKAVA